MPSNWTQKFYKEEIDKQYKPKVPKSASEEWKELKQGLSVKEIKKAGTSMLKRWLKIFIIAAVVIVALAFVIYMVVTLLLKMKLN